MWYSDNRQNTILVALYANYSQFLHSFKFFWCETLNLLYYLKEGNFFHIDGPI